MSTPLRVLLVEDSHDDALLLMRELRRGGYEPSYKRVETADGLRRALESDEPWDLIISDYNMPRFQAIEALRLLQEQGTDAPVVVVSGSVGEEVAVEAMRAGANDYVMKDKLTRLSSAVDRELREAEARRRYREAEEALRRSERRFRSLVEQATDSIFVLGPQGRIVDANRHACESLGYTRDELLSMSITEVETSLPHGSLAKVWEDVRSGSPITVDAVHRRKNGGTFPVEVRIGVFDKEQRLMIAVARDLTDRKEAERRLREAETRYRSLVEQIPAITYIQEPIESDNPKAVTYMSPQYETMLGYPPEEEILDEEHWLRTLHPEDRDRVLAEEVRTDATGEPFEIEYRVVARDGRVVWVRDQAVLVSDEDGRPLYWQGVQFDITERKRAEEELRRSEDRYRTFIGQSTEGIWRIELEQPIPTDEPEDEQIDLLYRHGYLAECNDAMARMYGYARADEVVGARLGDMIPRSVPENIEYLQAGIRSGYRLNDAESREVDREGGTKFFLNNLTGIVEDGRLVRIWGSQRDITQRKDAERRRDAQHALSSMLAGSASLREAAPRFLEAIGTRLGWELGALWMVDRSASVMHCSQVWGDASTPADEFEAASRRMSLTSGLGLPGRVWESGEPAWVEDVTEDANFLRREVAAREGLHGAFAFPIRGEGRVLGVVEFFSHRVLLPDEDLLRTVVTIGNQIGQFVEREEAGEARREMEERYRVVAETASDAIVMIDEDSRMLFVNDAAEEIFGHVREEMLGQKLTMLMPEPMREYHLAALRRYLDTGSRRVDWTAIQLPGLHKDGREIPLEVSFGEFVKDGRHFFTGFLRDITERKQAEDALRQGEERFRATFEQAAVGMAIVAPDGRWLRVNDRLCQIVGYSREEMLGLTFQDITHPGDLDADLDHLRRLLAGDISTYSTDKRYLRKDGSVVWIELTTSLVRKASGQPGYFISVVEDITDRKRGDEEQRFLAEAGGVLASSLDYRATLSSVARLAVPALADWCAVDMVEGDGSIGRLAVVHEDPQKVALAHRLQERYPPNPDAPSGVPYVLKSGRSEFHPEITDEMIEAAARDEEHLKLIRELGFTSVIIAPLVARGRILGVISLVSAESGRRYEARDLELAEELARRAALAVDNARLYQEARTEIAERRRAQEELRHSRDQLDIILRGVADGVIAQDADGRIFYSNDAAARMSGYPSASAFVKAPVQEIMSKFEVLDTEGRPFPMERLPGRRALRGEEGATEVIRFRIVETGEERWSVVRATPVFDEEGRPRMAVSIMRDITGQRRAEQERARLAAIVESSVDAIISKSLDGTITSWNSGAQRIYGYSAEEVVGRSITILVPPDRPDEIPEILEKLRRGEKVEHYETVRVSKDGRSLDISLTISPIRDSEGNIVGASTIARDITERKQAEQRMREVREAERSRIAQDIHDDTLQSLIYALQETQLLQITSGQEHGREDRDAALRDVADALRRSVEGLRSAIFDLRLEDTMDQSFTTSLRALAELTRRMSRSRFELSLEVDDGFPSNLLSRRAGGELIRVLQEALNNARRHSAARHISVRLWREEDVAFAEVADDGGGFDTGSSQGGVGTYSMRQRALTLGGELSIHSTPDSGTRVRLEMPVARLLEQ